MQVTSLHKGDKQLNQLEFFLIGNRFHVALCILSPKILFKQNLENW